MALCSTPIHSITIINLGGKASDISHISMMLSTCCNSDLQFFTRYGFFHLQYLTMYKLFKGFYQSTSDISNSFFYVSTHQNIS
jgi:CRISPR/Cas system-associated endonuclease Cas1